MNSSSNNKNPKVDYGAWRARQRPAGAATASSELRFELSGGGYGESRGLQNFGASGRRADADWRLRCGAAEDWSLEERAQRGGDERCGPDLICEDWLFLKEDFDMDG
ncbi:uncharacterized protein A4U43_C10F14430 [Asparagus officinalis]|uniref:Uncharacterized protein n=1 Tax=Asparagus officinalis TaxID=4686 RepID=A0A5P1E351_ASPOF|nr:uncharacterized protein A4U43_C10F14430 [Asparagus officinalis]